MRQLIPILILAALPLGVGTAQAPPGDVTDEQLELLLQEIRDLRETVESLRLELAQTRLDEAAAQRELDELHEFIRDHDAYGRDFQQYRAIKAATEQQARRRAADLARQQRAAERAARRQAIERSRQQKDAQLARVQSYRDRGFTPLGFDVFIGNAAFNYQTFDGVPARVDWNGLTGRFIRLGFPSSRVDFSSMTFSGSVLNASDEVRDIGIAITFFDESGNQVGGEIIQIGNARPDVPYPFTATIDMALNRPYATSSTYVLYADPSEPAEAAAPTPGPPGS